MLKPDAAARKDTAAPTVTMQHGHYAAIAGIIREEFTQWPSYAEEARVIAQRFASRLEKTNPKFDRERFLVACGIEE